MAAWKGQKGSGWGEGKKPGNRSSGGGPMGIGLPGCGGGFRPEER